MHKLVGLYLVICAIILSSCGSLSDTAKVLRNEKIKNTDEFLVKQRQPLTLPPDYESLPKPNSSEQKKTENSNDIKEIFKISKEKKTSSKNYKSIEQSIINKINK